MFCPEPPVDGESGLDKGEGQELSRRTQRKRDGLRALAYYDPVSAGRAVSPSCVRDLMGLRCLSDADHYAFLTSPAKDAENKNPISPGIPRDGTVPP